MHVYVNCSNRKQSGSKNWNQERQNHATAPEKQATQHSNHTPRTCLPCLFPRSSDHTLSTLPPTACHLHDIEKLLELHNQLPLILTDIAPEELFERVDTLPRNGRVEDIVFFQMATVHGLVVAFDLDGDGRLAAFADLHGLVVALDGCAVGSC
jgi:hypothetical protein